MEIDGIICIDKPKGFTSFDVVAKARGILKIKRIGHGGTLDPMATGVLPLFIGKATRAVDLVNDTDKGYRVAFQLGLTTDTLDITGEVQRRREVTVGTEEVEEAMAKFLGEIKQIPPMYSAVKVDGKRLYKLARQGTTVERKPRKATVYSAEVLGEVSDRIYEAEIFCSRGTYIRTIVDDLGEVLGCGAVMTALQRIKSGRFVLEDCISLDDLKEDTKRIPVDLAMDQYGKLALTKEESGKLLNGQKVHCEKPAGVYRLYDWEENFLALGEIQEELLKIKKLFITREV